jgi:hypothetical protein
VRAKVQGPDMQKAAQACARNGLWARGTPRVGYAANILPPGRRCKDRVNGGTPCLCRLLLLLLRP